MNNSDQDLVTRQQAWLKAVLAARGEDPTTLARGASLSPTTLTRFLNDADYPHALSARTIASIERLTGFVAYEAPAGITEPDAVPFVANNSALGAAIAALLGKGMAAWRLNRPTLTALGYLPGDIVVVDSNAKAARGDAVAADIRTFPTGEAATMMRVFHPPILVAAGGDPTAFPPLMIDDRTIIVRGVIVAGIRRRPR